MQEKESNHSMISSPSCNSLLSLPIEILIIPASSVAIIMEETYFLRQQIIICHFCYDIYDLVHGHLTKQKRKQRLDGFGLLSFGEYQIKTAKRRLRSFI